MMLRCLLLSPAVLLIAGYPFSPKAVAEEAAAQAAGSGSTESAGTDDPLEAANRMIFAFNRTLDEHILVPLAAAYAAHTSTGVRRGVHNAAANFGEPSIAVNDGLQGNFGRAWISTQRFVVNSTLGVAGVFDVAKRWDRPRHTADFGQTLGVWGIAPGPSVQVPILGPSNLRDVAGKVAGSYVNPLHWIQGTAMSVASTAKSGADVVDGKADSVGAPDPVRHPPVEDYAALRDAAAHRRAKLIMEAQGQ